MHALFLFLPPTQIAMHTQWRIFAQIPLNHSGWGHASPNLSPEYFANAGKLPGFRGSLRSQLTWTSSFFSSSIRTAMGYRESSTDLSLAAIFSAVAAAHTQTHWKSVFLFCSQSKRICPLAFSNSLVLGSQNDFASFFFLPAPIRK